MFKIYADNVKRKLEIGHQGENLSRCVCFSLTDLVEEFGEGTWSVVVLRHGETTPYLAENTDEVGDYAVWGLDDTDTAIAGDGRVELRYYVDDVLCKTDVYGTILLPSLGATGEAGKPWEDVLDELRTDLPEMRTLSANCTSCAASAAADARKAQTARAGIDALVPTDYVALCNTVNALKEDNANLMSLGLYLDSDGDVSQYD